MFADLEKSLLSDMKRYKDAKWEWHLAHEIIDAYDKERAFKDSLCAVENSADETAVSFLTVIFNEIEMAQEKLTVTYKIYLCNARNMKNNNSRCVQLN